MKDNFGLLETLDRLFSGDRRSVLTLDEFLGGLQGRSYAFAILALDVINVTFESTSTARVRLRSMVGEFDDTYETTNGGNTWTRTSTQP